MFKLFVTASLILTFATGCSSPPAQTADSVIVQPPPGKQYALPERIVARADGLFVAIFALPSRHSFALGCEEVAKLWPSRLPRGVPIPMNQWAEYEATINLVADIPCKDAAGLQLRKVVTVEPDVPDAILIKHRNGIWCRHYVDDAAWKAISGFRNEDLAEPVLTQRFPFRGIDFTSQGSV
jgi:hypothetical protein